MIMLAMQGRNQLRFFPGFVLPALSIWIASFAFFLAKSSYPNDMVAMFCSLASLIAALIFGFYRIVTISAPNDERS